MGFHVYVTPNVASLQQVAIDEMGATDAEVNCNLGQEGNQNSSAQLVQVNGGNGATKQLFYPAILGTHMKHFGCPGSDPTTAVESFQVRSMHSLECNVETSNATHTHMLATQAIQRHLPEAGDGNRTNPILEEESANRSHCELMARRKKNRERQRRYRARKRIEADMKNACLGSEQISSQTMEGPGPVTVSVARIYSSRDWKKDARMVQQSCKPSNLSHEPEVKVEPPSTSEVRCTSADATCIETNEAKAPARRDWKAEARNKD
ncbi:uncharacterized protein [Aristolochia californica]|uniref:uncharacterized protein n=1 Tax=Aristolochia californica TaxID=171875 RepID=UPI0035DD23B7